MGGMRRLSKAPMDAHEPRGDHRDQQAAPMAGAQIHAARGEAFGFDLATLGRHFSWNSSELASGSRSAVADRLDLSIGVRSSQAIFAENTLAPRETLARALSKGLLTAA